MKAATIVISILLLITALAVLTAILAPILKQISLGDPRVWMRSIRLRRKQRQLALAEEAVQKGELRLAQTLLGSALVLEMEVADPRAIEAVSTHNFAVLEKIMVIAEQANRHLRNLPVVEGLLQSRVELLRARAEIRASQDAVTKKRREKGQSTPEWALSEFERKAIELDDRLKTNRRSLESQFKELCSQLAETGGSTSGDVTYH